MSGVGSVILLSGGLDSAANLAFCAREDRPLAALTIRYGQLAEAREVEAAARLSAHYGVEHRVLDLRWLGGLGGSSLTGAGEVPELGAEQLDDPVATQGSARSVWVPNRNGLFINVAAALAERLGAGRVVVGFNREEAATFPDNSLEFLRRSTAALELSTANRVEVYSYTAKWDKREIVERLRAADPEFPLEHVWSCYHGGAVRCGRCESCRRFARALGED